MALKAAFQSVILRLKRLSLQLLSFRTRPLGNLSLKLSSERMGSVKITVQDSGRLKMSFYSPVLGT
jgi:hypothetical protein